MSRHAYTRTHILRSCPPWLPLLLILRAQLYALPRWHPSWRRKAVARLSNRAYKWDYQMLVCSVWSDVESGLVVLVGSYCGAHSRGEIICFLFCWSGANTVQIYIGRDKNRKEYQRWQLIRQTERPGWLALTDSEWETHSHTPRHTHAYNAKILMAKITNLSTHSNETTKFNTTKRSNNLNKSGLLHTPTEKYTSCYC